MNKVSLPKLQKKPILLLIVALSLVGFLSLSLFSSFQLSQDVQTVTLQFRQMEADRSDIAAKLSETEATLASQSARVVELESEDQRLINQDLQATIVSVQSTFHKLASTYEEVIDLRATGVKTAKLDNRVATLISQLSKQDYKSAELGLASLSAQIKIEKDKIAVQPKDVATLPQSNTPPASGYSRQTVTVGDQQFVVGLVAADLNSTKVLVDTASDGDCANDCPVMSVGAYAARNGAIAAINGSYFCPASYPSCAGKTNSFDTLLMNKNKKYFNSDNNVYSSVPAAIFSAGSARFVGKSQEWGRDTGVDAVIANYPLLVSGGQVVAGDGGDGKLSSRGSRSFIGNKGSTVYIGVVQGVTVVESGKVLAALGLDNALNLDSGGSTALWVGGGYKAGPGRDVPNVIILVGR